MSVSVSVNGNFQVTDSITGTTPITKVFQSLAQSGSVFTEGNNVLIGTSPTTLALPISPTNFLYIKNLSASNTSTVTWTPNGGSSNIVLTLLPGAALLFIEVGATAGITALSVTASAANTPIEYVLLG